MDIYIYIYLFKTMFHFHFVTVGNRSLTLRPVCRRPIGARQSNLIFLILILLEVIMLSLHTNLLKCHSNKMK